jgi:ABC-type sugar transport system permease subunit
VRPATTLVVIAATITGANFFTERYLLTGRGGPAGASVSPVLLMYIQGIEQGKAGYAAAIGVLLAIGVMVVSLVNRRQANPFGAMLAGAVVLTIPAVALFLVFQKRFQASNLGSGIKG